MDDADDAERYLAKATESLAGARNQVMTSEHEVLENPDIQSALEELKALILRKYPTATFEVTWEEDPDGVYLRPRLDVEDRVDVVDTYLDRLVDLQVDEGLPIHVIPMRTRERNAAILRKQETGFPRQTHPIEDLGPSA